MDRQPVSLRAVWDPEASVWFIAETSYPGLNTEAPTLDALVKRVRDALDSLREANSEPASSPELLLHIAA